MVGRHTGSTVDMGAYELQTSASDVDGDSMEDSWEIDYFGSTNAQPEAHGDMDDQNNLSEYIAGTDPTNPISYFAITGGEAGSFVVDWLSVSGRQYRVYWAETPTSGFQHIGPVIDYPHSSYTDTLHETQSSGFYKVEVHRK